MNELTATARRSGFTLIWISVILTVAALLMVSMLPGNEAGDNSRKSADTTKRLEKVEDAMVGFMAANHRRPCPADGQYDINNHNFGIEAANPGTCTGGTPSAPLAGNATSSIAIGGITQANPCKITASGHGFSVGDVISISGVGGMTAIGGYYLVGTVPDGNDFTIQDTGGNAVDCTSYSAYTSGGTATRAGAVAGVIPTKTLNLDDSYAFDGWGRRMTYIVDTRATQTGSCYNLQGTNRLGKGGIVIRNGNGGLLDDTMYAYISHGPDGHGAFPMQGSTVANRINAGSTDADTLTNASVDTNFNARFTNVKVSKSPTATFDDIVYYGNWIKNSCCVGPICQSYGFRIDGNVANGVLGMGYMAVAYGDVDGDGIPDLILAAFGAHRVYVIFGSTNGFPNPLPLSSLNGTNGFYLYDSGDNYFASGYEGWPIVRAADIDGDGKTDIIINGYGKAYVVYGGASLKGGAASYDISAMTACQAFTVSGSGGTFAADAIAVGDVNGDGIADLVIDDWAANGSVGAVYVLFGQAGTKSCPSIGPFPASINAATLKNDGSTSPHGVTINGASGTGSFGSGAGLAVGNITGHTGSTNDIIIGDSHDNSGYGRIFIVAGQASWPTTSAINAGSLAGIPANGACSSQSVTCGTVINDPSDYGIFSGMFAIGDVTGHGNGTVDIVAASNYLDVTVIKGSASAWNSSYNFSTASGGTPPGTFQITDGYAHTLDGGCSWGDTSISVVDLNGDGVGDIVAGCSNDTSNGSTYVIYGGSSLGQRALDTNPLTGSDGFRVDCSYSDSGVCGAATAGVDMNGDGIADLVVTVPYGNVTGSNKEGYAYVLFGSRKPNFFSNPFPLSNIY